ncbi:hypothetical protein AB0L05_15230 [Nonomuraea pusilla]|uniref:hypothetical protein n=1 Tax=Nonomuraea pusilla TaxID=46177 RepID=UPI003324C779
MRYAWLCHPATLAAVIVLLVNDHLLKAVWPGFLTGKLSDVAGLVVAPPLVALLFRRRADLAATLLTGALFTLVKTTQPGAELASQVWTLAAGPSRVLADPTDLLALPALALAWWIRSAPTPPTRVRVLAGVPLAVLAVTATSAVTYPKAVSVEADDRRVVVFLHEPAGDLAGLASEDGGATWTSWHSHPTAPPQTARCVPGQPRRCYRIVPGRAAVAESDDYGATFHGSWQLSEGRRTYVARTYPGGTGGYRPEALAVQARPGGGHVVVVANGVDGVLVRDVRGEWRRVGWPAVIKAPRSDPLAPEQRLALALSIAVVLAGIGTGLRRLFLAYALTMAAACWGVSLVVYAFDDRWVIGVDVERALLGAVIVTLAGPACLALALAGQPRARTVLISLGLGALTYAAVTLPFHGWAAGVPDEYGQAVAAAVVLTAGVLLGGLALLRRDARRAASLAHGLQHVEPDVRPQGLGHDH